MPLCHSKPPIRMTIAAKWRPPIEALAVGVALGPIWIWSSEPIERLSTWVGVDSNERTAPIDRSIGRGGGLSSWLMVDRSLRKHECFQVRQFLSTLPFDRRNNDHVHQHVQGLGTEIQVPGAGNPHGRCFHGNVTG